ncbi:SdiA-regulated domain-containing protein [Oceanihabitans sediminis]|uniref:T9SS C-terminal target domain-containing protein n=1 Tax=Oceanihabitans sediminis TaxID=1812012 RepID=A0A368PA37_9FLAO|nr:SdiA-regulated domain-containing protein [Oceanihabitans sediminis]MDX1278426.1 SdiA-regulated domain-containing protein [Oceanihabitans sediminis]MDX1773975.1 SdiA-regulated domain-containing protein [Oceanihabitans sediminis]RBP31998.1 SdiA-regulated protein [Oceanihabitans sediminis]RCU58659.1 hypothetical protein DU428_04595 [Oceanihabitans sediminis]
MFKKLFILVILLQFSCKTKDLRTLADLPSILKEVSGTEVIENSNTLWMVNDSGNKPILYGLDRKGNIKKELKIQAKNNDWEDLTSDNEGNIYIGDFGNNDNKRKNLTILKVQAKDLNSESKVAIEKISFYYPEQNKFPPKKSNRHFDCEAFFFYKDSLYLFTKSRDKRDFGKTNLYKIPAKEGNHEAKFISSLTTCNESHCWITSADISSDGKKVVLLSSKSVWLFTDFEKDDFLSGRLKEYSLGFISQKESISFKDSTSVYITDERKSGTGGKLYEFPLN